MLQLESPDQVDAFTQALAEARARLNTPLRQDRAWPAVAAAGFFAFAALAFAAAVILSPPPQPAPFTDVRAGV